MYILLVDDDASFRAIIEKMLTNESHSVVCAHNGAEALLLLQENGPFELVITDLQMPIMNGLEFIQALRSVHAPVPCLLHSSDEYAKIPEVGYVPLQQISDLFPFVEFHSKFERRYIQAFISKHSPS